jgi:hypothetical protein
MSGKELSMDRQDQRISDWHLERLALGELDEATARELERRVGREEISNEMQRLQASSEAILARLPAHRVAAAVAARTLPSSRRWLMALVPLAATVGLWSVRAEPRRPVAETVTIKGSTRLVAYRAIAGGALRLDDAAPAHAHDLIQLAYAADGGFGAIVSIDGRGVVTRHLPLHGDGCGAAPLATGEGRVPRAFELDDAPGFERFFLITGRRPFALAEVLAAADALARTPAGARFLPLALPPDLSQQSVLLQKVQP